MHIYNVFFIVSYYILVYYCMLSYYVKTLDFFNFSILHYIMSYEKIFCDILICCIIPYKVILYYILS